MKNFLIKQRKENILEEYEEEKIGHTFRYKGLLRDIIEGELGNKRGAERHKLDYPYN